MRSRPVSMLGMSLSLILVISACGTQSPSPGASTAGSPAGSAGTGDIPEQILNYAYHKAWRTLDPSNDRGPGADILGQIYETLTTYNTDTGEIEPELATSWDRNDDGTEWTFHLRENVQFHDGTMLTAEAVKASFERTGGTEFGGQGPLYLYEAITDMEAVDDLTLLITLSRPQPLDIFLGGGWGGYIMSPESVQQPQEWLDEGQGAGTGPYRWVSYERGQSAELERFPEYWGGWEAGQITRVVWSFVTDATTRQQLIESGEADLVWGLSTHSLPDLENNDAVTVFKYPRLSANEIHFNTLRAPTDDPLVRRAMAAAFPTDTVIETNWGGDLGYVTKNTRSFAAVALGGALEEDGFTFDLDEARDLLTEAGYPDGGLTVEMAFNLAFPDTVLDGELWKAELAKIGITLDILQIDSAEFNTLSDAPPDQRPAFLSGWTPEVPSPDNQMVGKFHSTSSSNESSYQNPELDALLAEGIELLASDLDAAYAKFQEANEVLFRDMPGFPYLDDLNTYVTASDITGLRMQRTGLISIYALRVGG